MKLAGVLIVLALLAVGGLGYYQFVVKKEATPSPSPLPFTTPAATPTVAPQPNTPDTKSAIQAFLAKKYNKPLSEVNVKIDKEVMGFASGTVAFGQGGPGEVGAWLAVLGNGWDVVWDGNGNVDCAKMRTVYGFPDTILKPNFCS